MIKILFVCHGNICRSPMAEFVMKDIARRDGREKDFYIASAATSGEEIGNPVYPPARTELAIHGLGCSGKRAVRVTRADYALYDYILVMDEYNLRNILRIFGGDPEGKVKKLLSYTKKDGDVADPWFTDRYDVAFDDIQRGCTAFYHYLKNQ